MALTFAAAVMSVTLTLPFFAADEPAGTPIISCGNGIPGGVNCVLSKKELKQAREIFARGVKFEEQNRIEEAFSQFDEASRMVPRNIQYLNARELVKAKIVFNHVEKGNALLATDSPAQAAVEFRAALDLDPDNTFARERLEEATQEQAVTSSAAPARGGLAYKLEDTGEIHILPKNDKATFHYRGDMRGLFSELAAAYGITVQFDDSVKARQVRFYVDDVDFFTALHLACQVSKTMWSALDTHQLLIAADSPENHKQFDRMSLRTFILPPHSTPQEVTDLVTTMRNMFDLRYVTTGQTNDTLEIRAAQPVIDACGKLLEQLSNQRPQVLFDLRIYQISHQMTRDIGLHVPDTFNLYNIPTAALAAVGSGQNIQQLINQLISSGGINQAGSSALSGLLAQLGGQNSIFSQPLATFGGGLTFMGLSLDQLTTALSVNESWARSLSDMQLRAGQGQDATFHLGERYPIMNASYAPIYNSPQISQVLGNQSYVPPFPSVSYEDLGLSVKVKPTVHRNNDVSVTIELQVRSLTGDSSNGVPVISNREYKGSINLKDGEPAVVAGQISVSDTLSMSGIPGFGMLPGLNQIMASNTKEEDDDELMIVITPHVISNIDPHEPEIWISER